MIPIQRVLPRPTPPGNLVAVAITCIHVNLDLTGQFTLPFGKVPPFILKLAEVPLHVVDKPDGLYDLTMVGLTFDLHVLLNQRHSIVTHHWLEILRIEVSKLQFQLDYQPPTVIFRVKAIPSEENQLVLIFDLVCWILRKFDLSVLNPVDVY
jgi:hypothetical protein